MFPFIGALALLLPNVGKDTQAVVAAPSHSATYATADDVYPADVGFYNVRDYGARGDGMTDDTAAIHAAMQAALKGARQPNHGAGGRGSTVYFPAGTYLVSDTLMWTQNPMTPAQITASVQNGAITGFTVKDGGSGYYSVWGDGRCGLWISGGGGSGAIRVCAKITDGRVTGVDMRGQTRIGQGFTSVPKIEAVNWRAYLRFEGQNKATTIIRLRDHAPGFTDPDTSISVSEGKPRPNAKAVLYVGNEGSEDAIGAGEDAYMNDIWNLTVDVGRGNAGASGIDWIGSNRASIRNVNIVSEDGAGRCGLNVSRNEGGSGGGPAYIKNISISGFDEGIDADSAAGEVGYTFEDVDLAGQRVCGVLVRNMSTWFRGVASRNAVPAFDAEGQASLEVVDADLLGGSPAADAILAHAPQGVLFLRNVTARGYRSSLASEPGEKPIGGAHIAEYADPPPVSLFASRMTSLNLPVPPTPEWTDNHFADWADVSTYSPSSQPNSGRDATQGIQEAMDSGKPVVFFPYGTYITTATIRVPSTVRKILGCNSLIRGPSRQTFTTGVFSFDGTGPHPVELRNFVFDISTVAHPTLVDNGASPLVIADIHNANGYANTSRGRGSVFFENTSICGPNFFNGQSVYAHQWDTEDSGIHNQVRGGRIWVFGFKSEYSSPLWDIQNAEMELLGAFFTGRNGASAGAMFTAADSRFSLCDIANDGGFPVAVAETRRGFTRTLPANGRRGGMEMGLFSGQSADAKRP